MTLQNKADNDKNAKEKFDQELIEYQEEVDELHSQNKDLINGKKIMLILYALHRSPDVLPL